MLMRTIADMQVIRQALRLSNSWNPHAKFFICCIDVMLGEDWPLLVTTFFREFWKDFVINISIMVPDTKTRSEKVTFILLTDFKLKKITTIDQYRY